MRTVALAVVACVLTGCLEELAPEVGPLVAPACANVDSDPGQPVRFAEDVVARVLGPACFRCHTPGGRTPIGLAIGGLDLSTYASLRAGGARGGADVVIDGQPCASVLVQKVGNAPPFGARMPLDGGALVELDRQLLADWIAEGARDD